MQSTELAYFEVEDNLAASWTWSPAGNVRVKSTAVGDWWAESNSDEPTYIIANGDASDFKKLQIGHGLTLPLRKTLFFESKVESVTGAQATLEILEYDQDRNRIGEVRGKLNHSFEVEFGGDTSFVLICIRIVGFERIGLSRLVVVEEGRLKITGENRLRPITRHSVLRDVSRNKSLPSLFASSVEDRSIDQVLIAQALAFSNQPKVYLEKLIGEPFGEMRRGVVSESDEAIRKLVSSYIFDPVFYQSSVGVNFEGDLEAAKHFLSVGMKRGLSSHPLLEIDRLPENIRSAWKIGQLDAVLQFLRRPRNQVGMLGEYFDANLIEAPSRVELDHPGGSLGWFVEHARPKDFVPSEYFAIRWEDFKNAVHRSSVQELVSRRGGSDRLNTRWDTSVERQFKSSILSEWLRKHQSRPLVSIVMPTWNRASIISGAIDSVLSQTYENFELVIVDDGSIDNTEEVVTEFLAKDQRVRFVASDHLGVCHSRNVGIGLARGKYLAFLDTDNQWQPEFLELMVAALEISGERFGYSALSIETESGMRYRCFEGGAKDLAIKNHIDLNVMMVERELVLSIGGFDESLRRWVDHDLALRLSKLAEPVFMPFIGCKYENGQNEIERITTSESESWQWMVLAKEWADLGSPSSIASKKKSGRVSIVIPMYGNHEMTRTAIRAVLKTTLDDDVEIVLVDNGSPFDSSWRIATCFASDSRVRNVRAPRNLNFSIGSNLGVLNSTGEYILFLNNDTEVREGWLRPLVERLKDPEVIGVQPLLLFGDDSIQSAGTAFVAADSLPVPFLASYPSECALNVSDLRFNVVTAAALLMRAREVERLGGFSAMFINGMEDIDLCLRASNGGDRHFVVEPRSVVQHHESKTPGRGRFIQDNRREFMKIWRGNLPSPETHLYEKVGFEIVGISSDGGEQPAPRVTLRRSNPSKVSWGIKYASVGGEKGDKWGDTAFVDSLKDSLLRAGQLVNTYRHGTNTDYEHAPDQVNLVIRGLDKVSPIPGQVNILWVISHPEAVSMNEILGFDLVYSASETWARKLSAKTGRQIRTMLQATDINRFNLSVEPRGHGQLPVFVGSVHPGRRRNIVEVALGNNIPIEVIGNGWRGRLPERVLKADFVDNSELSSVYRSATRVLADHWGDMAEEGFIQNRVFDAVASGCRVISDPVPGIEELFDGAVRVYHTPEELRYLCSIAGDKEFPSEAEMIEIASRCAAEHSFDARVNQMICDVNEFVEQRGAGNSWVE